MRMLGVEKHIRQLAKGRYSNHGHSMANNRIQVIGPVTGLWENYRGFPATSVARSDPIDRSRQASVNGSVVQGQLTCGQSSHRHRSHVKSVT